MSTVSLGCVQTGKFSLFCNLIRDTVTTKSFILTLHSGGGHSATTFTCSSLVSFATETPLWLSWTEAGREKWAWDTTALFAQAGAAHGKDLLIRLFAYGHKQMFADKGLGRVTVCSEASWRRSSQTRGTRSDTYLFLCEAMLNTSYTSWPLLCVCFKNPNDIIL